MHPPLPAVKVLRNDEVFVYNTFVVESEKETGNDGNVDEGKGKVDVSRP